MIRQKRNQAETELSYEFGNKIEKKIKLWIGTENFLMLVRQKGFKLGVHCLVPPYCFSSSQSASLLSPKKQE